MDNITLAEVTEGHSGEATESIASDIKTATEHVEKAVEHSPALLSFDPGVAIWTWFVFFILLFILKKTAWGPILSAIESREKNLRDSLEKAKEAHLESRRIAEEQNKILNEARGEAANIVQSAKAVAEELKKKLENSANEEKARILESARKEIDVAKKMAMDDLRRTAAGLALDVAEKLIAKSMDDAEHKELVDKLITELSTQNI